MGNKHIPDSLARMQALRPDPGKKETYLQDSQLSYLSLRVSPKGQHIFYVRGYDWTGKQVRVKVAALGSGVGPSGGKIADVPVVISLQQARLLATATFNNLSVQPEERITLKKCLADYLIVLQSENNAKDTIDTYRRLANKHLWPYFDFDIRKDITEAWLQNLRIEAEKTAWRTLTYGVSDEVKEQLRNAPTLEGIHPDSRYMGVAQTYRLFALLGGMLTHFKRLKVIEENPLKNLTADRQGKREGFLKRPKARSRYIPVEKVKDWWEATEELTHAGRQSARALKLQLILGWRGQAISAIEKKRIKLKRGYIRIRSGDKGQKGRKACLIHLTPLAIEVIKEQLAYVADLEQRYEFTTPYLFPSRVLEKAKAGKHLTKDRRRSLKQVCDKIGITLDGCHDIRRTFATIINQFATDEMTRKSLMGKIPQERQDSAQTPLDETYVRMTQTKPALIEYDEFIQQLLGRIPHTPQSLKTLEKLTAAPAMDWDEDDEDDDDEEDDE